jgi:hypothetical protein
MLRIRRKRVSPRLIVVIVATTLLCACSSSNQGDDPREALAKAAKRTLAVQTVRVTLTTKDGGVPTGDVPTAYWQTPDRLRLERGTETAVFIKYKWYLLAPGDPTRFELGTLDDSYPPGVLHFPVPELGRMAELALSVDVDGNGDYRVTTPFSTAPSLLVSVADGLIVKVVITHGSMEDSYALTRFDTSPAVAQPVGEVIPSTGRCGGLPPSPALNSARRCKAG